MLTSRGVHGRLLCAFNQLNVLEHVSDHNTCCASIKHRRTGRGRGAVPSRTKEERDSGQLSRPLQGAAGWQTAASDSKRRVMPYRGSDYDVQYGVTLKASAQTSEHDV